MNRLQKYLYIIFVLIALQVCLNIVFYFINIFFFQQVTNSKNLFIEGQSDTHVTDAKKEQSDPGSDLSLLWPVNGGEKNDRILNQLEYSKPNVTKWKTIVLFSHVDEANKRLYTDSCKVKNCIFTGEKDLINIADAVLFEIANPTYLPNRKDQIWIYFTLEAPRDTGGSDIHFMNYNFTATYRRDSVLVTPYAKYVMYEDHNNNSLPEINYATGKTKLVAWFVSNCNARNGRHKYVHELQNYIDVDIYGYCGSMVCPRSNETYCDNILSLTYKFYLAFENSNCIDYITEKFFQRGLGNNILPVVMGARKEDYEKVAPHHSYVHVDDFESPKELAEYLHLLDRRDDLYNSYFKWKGRGSFINTKFYCRLCSMVHASHDVHIQYKNMTAWWQGPGTCVPPHGDLKWATWRS